jgi:hypothetical protein
MIETNERITRIIDTTPLLPVGILEVKSTGTAINTKASVQEAAAHAARDNTREALGEWFNPSSEKQRVLDIREFDEGRITLMEPTGKYAHIAWMIAAAERAYFDHLAPTEQVAVRTAYQAPFEFHTEYMRYGIEALLQARRLAPSNINFLVENAMPIVTDENHRVSRSIALKHMHVVSLDPTKVIPTDERIAHLEKEQRLLRRVIPRVIDTALFGEDEIYRKGLYGVLQSYDQRVAIGEKLAPPVGYTMHFKDIHEGNVRQAIEPLVAIVRADHKLYENIEKHEQSKMRPENQERMKPLLSKREYLYFDENGYLNAIRSPQKVSHAGGMEAGGTILRRTPDAEEVYSRQQYDDLNMALLKGLGEIKN